MHRTSWRLVVGLLVCSTGCHPSFQALKFPSSEALYEASLRQFNRGKMDDAVVGFDKLTLDLSARDTLLPRSYWYLGVAYQRKNEHVLAAETFSRLFQSFGDDSLAPSAALRAAREYAKLWTNVGRDPEYGFTSLGSYQSVIQFYADKPQADTARAEAATIEDRFARKDYETGMYYWRDHAPDPALIYFRDVIAKYPSSPTARRAALRMVEIYKYISYAEERAELCAAMREKYPDDAEVKHDCPAPAQPPSRDTTHAAPSRFRGP